MIIFVLCLFYSNSVTIKTEPLECSPKPKLTCVDTPIAAQPVAVLSAPEPPLKRIKMEFDLTDDTPSTSHLPVVPAAPLAAANEPKYCNICDIKFTYLNTYIAHKQYYCKEAAATSKSAVEVPMATAAAVSPKPTVKQLQ